MSKSGPVEGWPRLTWCESVYDKKPTSQSRTEHVSSDFF